MAQAHHSCVHEISVSFAENEEFQWFQEFLLVGFGHLKRAHIADIRVFSNGEVREYSGSECKKHGVFPTVHDAALFAERRADELTAGDLGYTRHYRHDKHGERNILADGSNA